MATEIELPDGTILEAPDGVDPSTVAKAYLAKQRAPTSTPARGSPLATLATAGRPGGGEEALLSMATSFPAMIAGGLSGIAGTVLPGPEGQGAHWTEKVQNALTYRPRSPQGQAALDVFSSPLALLDRGATEMFAAPAPKLAPPSDYRPMGEAAAADEERYRASQNKSPLAATIGKTFVEGVVPMLLGGGGPRPLAAAENAAPTAGRSAGAAASAVDLAATSPELRAEVSTAKYGVNHEALARQARAERLPVPIRLTEGEATRDTARISEERNQRGTVKQIQGRMDDTNKRLGQNLAALRDQVGPEVFSTNAVEHGDTLIRAYKDKNEAAEAGVNAKYKALRDANGGNFPVDAPLLLENAVQRLHQELLYDDAPRSLLSPLENLAKNDSMTFENFVSLRKKVSRIQRSMTADGNVKAAAGIIRQAMEELPIRKIEADENLLGVEGPGSAAAQKLVNQQYRFAKLKKLADEATAAARKQFEALEADPAYKAAVDDTVAPDHFVGKFVIRGTRDNVDLLMRNIGNEPAARQTVSVSVLDHLREAARLNPSYEGNFSADGFNKALGNLSPKANLLFDARTAETIGDLGAVATDSTFQPRGHLINNSNSTVAALAEKGGTVLEHVANAHMPFAGTAGRGAAGYLTRRRLVNRALKPGAGVALPKPKRGVTKRDVME